MTSRELTARAVRTALELMARRGHTRASFARAQNLPASTVYGWLSRPGIGLVTLAAMAKALKIEPAVLLLSTEDRAFLEAVGVYLDDREEFWKSENLRQLLGGRS